MKNNYNRVKYLFIRYLVLVVVIITGFSCQIKHYTVSDWNKLTGHPKKCVITYSGHTDDWYSKLKTITYYNKHGEYLGFESYDSANTLTEKMEHFYYRNKTIEKRFMDGEWYAEFVTTFDPKNLSFISKGVSRKTTIVESGTIDEKGNFLKEKSNGSDEFTSKKTYDERGNVVEEFEKDWMGSGYGDSALVLRQKYEYSESNCLIQKTLYGSLDTVVTNIINDRFCNETEIYETIIGKTKELKKRFTYQYDNENNWIERVELTDEKDTVQVVYRSIEYY